MASQKTGLIQIGTGGIGNFHLAVYKDLPDIEVIGVYDVNQDAARKAAEKHGVETVFESLEAALDQPRADMVTVATPNRYHADITIKALEAGKHVVCEKPLAPTAAEVERMIAARDKAGKLLMTAQHMRFDSRSQALRRLIEAGRLGEVYYSRARWLRRWSVPATPGFISKQQAVRGPGADIGVHVVDLAMHLMDHPRPVSVSGMSVCKLAKQPGRYNSWGTFKPEQFEVEDFAAGWVRFANGAVLTIEVSWMLNTLEQEEYGVELYGDRGGAAWPTLRWVGGDGDVFSSATIESVNHNAHNGHQNEFRAFVDAIHSGGPSPVPAEQSLTVARILDALYESAEKQREVRLDEK